MGMDLEGAGGYFRWTRTGWTDILTLAEQFEWEPTGTGPPKGTRRDEWTRDYSSSVGQLLYARDAKNLADALGRALKESPETWIVDSGFLASTDGARAIRDFIRYCRKGSFRIY